MKAKFKVGQVVWDKRRQDYVRLAYVYPAIRNTHTGGVTLEGGCYREASEIRPLTKRERGA